MTLGHHRCMASWQDQASAACNTPAYFEIRTCHWHYRDVSSSRCGNAPCCYDRFVISATYMIDDN